MLFKRHYLYFQVDAGTITAKDISSGVAVTKQCSGLLHPRTLMGDFGSIESCFRELVSEQSSGSLFKAAPTIIVHLKPVVEGGYTPVEVRAFKEAAFGAGGREVFVTDVKFTLTDDQIINGNFEMLGNES